MTPRDLLEVFIRIAGLICPLLAANDVLFIISKVFNIQTGSVVSLAGDIFACAYYTVLGVGVLVFARTIRDLAFRW